MKIKRKLWEILSVVFASILVFLVGGYNIAMSQSAAINTALNISGSSIERSTDEAYKYFPQTFKTVEEMKEYYVSVCEQVEAEGLVLLRNENNALPLEKGDKVSCFLSGSVRFNYGSSGSSSTDTSEYKDLKTALTEQGLSVNEALWNYYGDVKGRTKSGETYRINEPGFDEIDADSIAKVGEYGTVIVTIARDSGEGADISTSRSDGEDKTYLALSETEADTLVQLTNMKKAGTVKKIIVLLNSSATLELDFMYREDIDVDACLWVGNVGVSGINAVAKALTGDVIPSGKLSDTYLRDNFSSPAMMQQAYNYLKSFAGTYTNAESLGLNDTQSHYGVYNEGIYVGYRYYETRYTDYVNGTGNAGDYDYSKDVAFAFGYGISYTRFEYSDFAVEESADGSAYNVSVKVTNKGDKYSGKEVVEVYLQKPYTDYDKENGVEKAAVELAGYAKTSELAPGASETVTITVAKSQFKSYDANKAKTYILDAGKYYLTVANGAHEAANNILAKQGKTPANTDNRMDAEGNASLCYETKEFAFDDTTYSVSEYTGEKITNQFDFADLNKYEGSETKVTYVSRSDWQGTLPTAAIEITVTDKMLAGLTSNKAIKEDASAVMPAYGQKNKLTLAMMRGKAYDDPDWDKLLDQTTFGEQAYLISNGYFTTVVMASVGKPDTAESDGPTGLTYSKYSLSFPSEGIWASSYNDELIEKVGDCLAEDASSLGLTGIYAGGVNIHRTPFGGRSHEYFSEDPFLTAKAAVAETKGLQAKGVIAHIKHFAFNDQETYRNGICIWLNEQEAREIMLYPFEAVLSINDEKTGAHAVMTAFNRVGTDWAGANENLLKNVLIGEWGFDGYNITDMASSNGASYMTYQDGVMLGTNVFLGSGSESALDSFKDSAAFAQNMRESTHRVLYAVANYSSAMNGISPETTVMQSGWWWRTLLIGLIIGFGVLTLGAAVMYALGMVKEKKAK